VKSCGVCRLHADSVACARYEIGRGRTWVLRRHPDPAPLPGWLLLDSRRHLGGPIDFSPEEAAAWGSAVQDASRLVQSLSGIERVYAIGFGEGARHLHLIPRFGNDPDIEAWKVADLYRMVMDGSRAPAPADQVAAVQPMPIFIGVDPRERAAINVLFDSLTQLSSTPLAITPMLTPQLEKQGGSLLAHP
jgi:diadenosine tetraphosphate (Ap4A) HIT family hydrolase